MKKLVSVFLISLIAVSLCIPVLAASPGMTGDGTTAPPSVTIKNAQTGQVYNAYKIFDLNFSPEEDPSAFAYTITDDSPWYTAVSSFAGDHTKGLKLTKTAGDSGIYVVEFSTSEKPIDGYGCFSASDFSKTLFAVSPKPSPDGSTVGPDPAGPVTVNLTEYGYYFVTSNNGTVCSLTSTAPHADIYDKNEAPRITKTVDDVYVELGQTVNFTIEGKVPSTIGYTHYYWMIQDTWTNGLTFNGLENFHVSVNDEIVEITEIMPAPPVFPLDTDTIEFHKTDGVADGFQLVLDVCMHPSWKTGDTIKITYQAIVNENAVDIDLSKPLPDINEEKNTAQLIYSNDPSDENSIKFGTPEEVSLYICNIFIHKYDKDDPTMPLADAHFILYRKVKNAADEEIPEYYRYIPEDSAGGSEPLPRVEWTLNRDEATEVITDSEGHACFKGLEAGEYWLRETKAPDGYNMFTEDVQISLGAPKIRLIKETSASAVQIGPGEENHTVIDVPYVFPGPFPYSYEPHPENDTIPGANPGWTVGYRIRIKNESTVPLNIRISFERKLELDPAYNHDPQIEPDVRVATHDFNTADWTYNAADKCYHYNMQLQPGETTEPLCTQVHFSGALMGNQYNACVYTVKITPYSDGEGAAAGNKMVEIANETGAELPETGGMGTTAFTLCGLLLTGAAAAGMLIIFKNRKRKTEI